MAASSTMPVKQSCEKVQPLAGSDPREAVSMPAPTVCSSGSFRAHLPQWAPHSSGQYVWVSPVDGLGYLPLGLRAKQDTTPLPWHSRRQTWAGQVAFKRPKNLPAQEGGGEQGSFLWLLPTLDRPPKDGCHSVLGRLGRGHVSDL